MVLFNNRLKDERTRKGLSQEELGKHFNLDKSTISLYESGKRQPDYSTLSEFAEYFNCSTDYLLGRTDERTPVYMVKEESNLYKTTDSMLDDLLLRVPDLTEEEKLSLAEHMKIAVKHIEEIRKLRAEKNNS